MKTQELRNLTNEELLQKEKGFKEELLKLSMQRFAGRVEKPHLFSIFKKDIARVKTIIMERKKQK